ncbi:hypothetical protein OQJ13_16135 [Legionella sp. PATHC035]|uniref:hypothetical protein n=1 Tax=Legionella sp. PATHC035 TaxID=2992040 RepID=UPI0022433A3D|nr:hypothetical protein [Legionella sp. PATHC035]MCW8410510.1 hypothetical protein [Legionella sp. PATHC035]
MTIPPLKSEAKVKEESETPFVSSLLLVIEKLITQLQQQGDQIEELLREIRHFKKLRKSIASAMS